MNNAATCLALGFLQAEKEQGHKEDKKDLLRHLRELEDENTKLKSLIRRLEKAVERYTQDEKDITKGEENNAGNNARATTKRRRAGN